MMFLIAKIFVYLFLAGLIGVAAGWLLRNLQGQRSEESASRAAYDAKSKLPQMESLLRGRDDQISKLKAQLAEAKCQAKDHAEELRELEQQLQTKQQELSRALEAQTAGELHNPVIELDESQGTARTEPDLTVVDELQAQLAAAEQELAAAREALAQEQDRIADLTRERELQASSLQALNQQLELARSRLVANG